MPWTQRETRFLLSSGSPLSNAKKESMKAELHADPGLGHQRRGSAAMRRPRSRMAQRFREARRG